jgi:hypothetical protein
MINKSFWAVATNDPDRAIAMYIHKTGQTPTIILVRPGFVPTKRNPIIVESRHAMQGAMMVSHLITPEEVNNDDNSVFQNREASIKDTDLNRVDLSFPTRKIGRPGHTQAICPQCHGKITHFEELGYWYGWALGITPSYWDELRLYVFERDHYKCQNCQKKYPPALLNAHHIERKEDMGSDSSRNLTTLCIYCHTDLKPIMPETQGAE